MSLVLREKRNRIAYITLNRPEARNVGTIGDELAQVLLEFRDDPEAWVVIITGAGEAFSAGGDLEMHSQRSAEWWREFFWQHPAPSLMRGIEIWKPIIAAVNGEAAGAGCMLALACDIRIASERASFRPFEVQMGWVAGLGGTQRLPRLLPLGIALEMLFTGDPIDAQEAYRLGLVNRVVIASELMTTATRLAERICENPPLAVRANKEAAIKGLSMTLEQGLRLETILGRIARDTEDAQEWARAFREKRKPLFKGR